MITLIHIANFLSIIGTLCGLFSRVPQVIKTYKTKSAQDLSLQTISLNIMANSCFLFYTIIHEQYPIMFNCLSVIILESSLIYMKKKFKVIKKSSSQTDLIKMNLDNSDLDEYNII